MKRSYKKNERSGLLAVGNWIIDHIKFVDTWPEQDALATIMAQSDGNGGGPYNLLKDLARMRCGFPLAGIGLVGKDSDGESILRDCDAHHIDRTGFHQTNAVQTSYTDVITVVGTGRRTFFHQQGANALLGLGHVNLAGSSARIFYLGYMCLLRTLDHVDATGLTGTSRLFAEASRLGMTTVGDLVSSQTSDFAAQINPSLPHLDYLLLNEYELARLAGVKLVKTSSRLEAAARKILKRGVRQGVVVHLPEAAVCVSHGQSAVWQPSVRMPQKQILGAAGAGDAFAAGFIYGVHETWGLQRSMELGVCVAAASLREAACSAAVEPWKNCLELGRKLGFRRLLK